MKRRIISLFLAIAMIFGMMPVGAFATGETSVKVGFTVVDCLDGEIDVMRKELKVTPGLAQTYFPEGQYGGSVGMSTEVGPDDVTPIDVLVAAHLDAYGDDFANAPDSYISGFDYVTKMFGEESEITWTANGIMAYLPAEDETNQAGYDLGYAINQYIVQPGDEICFYRMSFFSYPGNVYASFDKTQAEIEVGEELNLNLGFCSTMTYSNDKIPVAQLPIYYMNADGTIGEESGFVTDVEGNVTVSFEEAGTYYLTCQGEVSYYDEMMGGETAGTLSPAYLKVTVKEAAAEETTEATEDTSEPTEGNEDVTSNNVIDATLGGTRLSPSNVAYIDKITIGDTVGVKEASFEGLACNVILAEGTAPDATFEVAFSHQNMMPDMFGIAYSGDLNEDGTTTVTLEDGSAFITATVQATLPGNNKTDITWSINFTTTSGGSSMQMIPVELRGNLWDDVNIGIKQFIFKDCKVLDYNWAADDILNVHISDATASDGSFDLMYNLEFAQATQVSVPSPYTVQLENGKATVQYDITAKSPYSGGTHSITVNITNKGLTPPELAEGVEAEVSASAFVGEAYSLDLSKVFTDAENDAMTYTVSIDGESAVAAEEQFSFTADVISDYELVFRAHDGMNESEVSYTVNLSVTKDTSGYPVTVMVPESITPSFYITKKFLDDGTDQPGNELSAAEGETEDGWTSYNVKVPMGVERISVRGVDADGVSWGGMALNVVEEGVYKLRTVKAIINSKLFINNESFYPTAEQAVFKVEYALDDDLRYAVNGGSFNDEYGYLGYRFLLLAADNALLYTYYAEPMGEVAEYYTTNVGVTKTITTDSADLVTATLPLGTKSSFTITAPKEAKVQMFAQSSGNYYGAVEYEPYQVVDNGDGTKNVIYNNVGRQLESYRVSMEGKITKAGYVSAGTVDGSVTVTWEDDDPTPDYRRVYEFDQNSYYRRADDSMVVNVNYRNNLLLDVNETHTLRAYRIWQIINNDTQNVMIEPDFHINVLSGKDVISITPYENNHTNAGGNRMNITGLKEGTAILEVSYDAIAIMERDAGAGEIGGMGGLTFNACDPTRTALIVVQVGAEQSDVDFGIVNNGGNAWDAECDTVYFLGEQGQIELNPTVASGSIAQVAVSNDKGESWTVLTSEDGTYTATLIPGNNIIRITKGDGTVSYQLVRGDQISYTVEERLDVEGADGDGVIEAGEPVVISITGTHMPFGKMAGISNPWQFLTRYDFENEQTKAGGSMYGYAHDNKVMFVIPENAQPGDICTLTNGYSELGTAFGSGGGGYRDAGDVVPPNLDAEDSIGGTFNIFPDLTVTVGGNTQETDPTEPSEPVQTDPTDPSEPEQTDPTEPEENLDFGLSEDEIIGYATVSFVDFGDRVAGEEMEAIYVEPLGVIVEETNVPFKAYDTVAAVTLRLLDALDMTYLNSGDAFSNFYLSSIGNFDVNNVHYDAFGEFDAGQSSGWMITQNDVFINKGASEFLVKDGDVLEWQYTCQLGADIGDNYKPEESEPTDPSEPEESEPTEPSNPAESEPTEPSKPEESEPTEPSKPEETDPAEPAYADIYKNTGDYMESLGTPTVNSIGGEWMVIGLVRSGRDVPEGYYDEVVKYVQENINDKEQLHRAKSTENARVILALTAAGYDVTNVDGHNLLVGLNTMSYVKKQGNNGPIWALIAFDSHNYEIPEGDVTRDKLIDTILAAQLPDGGWSMSSVATSGDADLTGMAIQALAPYYETNTKVKSAVDKALVLLSELQEDDGSYGSVDGKCTESTAQVIVALTAMGVDPEKDNRFVKNGNSAVDALNLFYVEGGGFKHTAADTKADGMATEQGYYALAAYDRFLNGETSLYDMSDVKLDSKPTEPEKPKVDVLQKFKDLEADQWYIEAIDFVVNEGLMNGMSEDEFAPNRETNRAMMAMLLYRMEGSPSVDGMSNPFQDVKVDEWYYDAVVWAANAGVVKGVSEDKFDPDANVTREQMVTMMHRYIGEPEGADGAHDDFDDATDVSEYAEAAMAWAVENGIINGFEDNTVQPKGNSTRAQIATVLMRYITNQ